MENEGFEEEQQPRIEQTSSIAQQFPAEFSYYSSMLDISSFSASNADDHVYEDILLGVEDVSKPRNESSAYDSRKFNTNDLSFDVIDYVPRNAKTKSLSRQSSTFRRNLTLPFCRPTGLESGIATASVRVTSRERIGYEENAKRFVVPAVDDAILSEEVAPLTECKPSRRRRKKDCKHCKSKAVAREQGTDNGKMELILKKNGGKQEQQRLYSAESQTVLDSRNLEMVLVCPLSGNLQELSVQQTNSSTTVFTIPEKTGGSVDNAVKLIEYDRNDTSGHALKTNEDKSLIAPERSQDSMRVNSIYSQDRWYAKQSTIFYTDVKEHSLLQRAYTLPVQTQTPSSQNRVNLRRSVGGESPPHPARLHKHRHGWTLYLARPLKGSGCTRSLGLLLVLLLALLGIGAVALYIVFEPEKLQIIQQYLKSSLNNSSSVSTQSVKTFIFNSTSGERNNSPMLTATPVNSSLLPTDVFSDVVDQYVRETGAVAGTTSSWSLNFTRYCDDCVNGEVCVALLDEEVPVCRIGLDYEDPTGCAGFCLINKQRCHRLDVDAFRCVEVEHYCLDDEWTCTNALCIPKEKRCDGHMNCYDHSDEHDCVCDPGTHFQCGNETSCLPLEKRCDGKIDCWDAADEINCTIACPSENEFTCSSGQCIPKARFCDGLPDCLDGSDEPHGCKGRCNKHEFTCQNSRCIAKGMKCNGTDDCGDGSDERHCKDRFS